MGKDYVKKLRAVDAKNNRINENNLFVAKIQKCYNPIKRFVDKEIEKGANMHDAVDRVLGSASINMLYSELNEDAVKRKIRNLLISYYSNKDMNKQGDER